MVTGHKDHSLPLSIEPVSDPDSGDCVVKPNDNSLVAHQHHHQHQQHHQQQQHPNFGRSCNFPNKLYDLLEYAAAHDGVCGNLIAWSNDGLSFDIWNPRDFMMELGTKFFPQQASFRALERQLNNWGFIRTKLPRRALRFYHPLFQRDKPHLKRQIHRSTLHKPTPPTSTTARTYTGTCTSTKNIQSADQSSPRPPLSGMGHGRRLKRVAMFQIHPLDYEHDHDDDDDSCSLLNRHFTSIQESFGFFKYTYPTEKHFYFKAHA